MDRLESLFGTEHREIATNLRGVRLEGFRHDCAGESVVSVVTHGLDRELACTMLEQDWGAAAALVRLATVRQQQELRGPWEEGRVWLNDQPLLEGSLIQALVVRRADVDHLYGLTDAEAQVVAANTVTALDIALARHPLAFTDPLRDDYWDTRALSDDSLPSVTVLTSKLARTAPLRHLEHTAYRRFVALTLEEPEGYLDNPDNVEIRTASELLPQLYGARTFFVGAQPGETLRYTQNGWEYSVA